MFPTPIESMTSYRNRTQQRTRQKRTPDLCRQRSRQRRKLLKREEEDDSSCLLLWEFFDLKYPSTWTDLMESPIINSGVTISTQTQNWLQWKSHSQTHTSPLPQIRDTNRCPICLCVEWWYECYFLFGWICFDELKNWLIQNSFFIEMIE